MISLIPLIRTLVLLALWRIEPSISLPLEEPLSHDDLEEKALGSDSPETVGGIVERAFEWPHVYDGDQADHRELQLSDDCVEDGPYFYSIDVSVTPGGSTSGRCRRSDQILLGHDLVSCNMTTLPPHTAAH